MRPAGCDIWLYTATISGSGCCGNAAPARASIATAITRKSRIVLRLSPEEAGAQAAWVCRCERIHPAIQKNFRVARRYRGPGWAEAARGPEAPLRRTAPISQVAAVVRMTEEAAAQVVAEESPI